MDADDHCNTNPNLDPMDEGNIEDYNNDGGSDWHHWMSDEQEESTETRPVTGMYPKAEMWKTTGDEHDVTVTVDMARRYTWRHAKININMLRQYWGTDSPSFDSLVDDLFGRQSKLFHIFNEELKLDFEQYCMFLATFFLASLWSVPPAWLHESHRFKTDDLMPPKEYNEIVRRIDGLSNGTDDAFWMKLEDGFNSVMKKIFLSHRNGNDLVLSLDDDKVHFLYSKATNMFGLKPCHHQKANRHGFTIHTLGCSATGIVVGVGFERETETQCEVYIRILKKLFGASSGNGAADLQGITFCSDRGYWTPYLLFDVLLAWGAHVLGTVARTFWYPFVYTKKNQSVSSDKHNRINIMMKGYRDVWYRSIDFARRKLHAICFRSGTGTAVSLAMSSKHHLPVFDFNLRDTKDSKWYHDTTMTQTDRNGKAFSCLHGSKTDFDSIDDLPIRPLTCTQTDASWFVMRRFAFTSSTVDKMINKRAKEIMPDHEYRKAYETIMKLVDREGLLSTPVPGLNNADTAATTTTTTTVEEQQQQESISEDDERARMWIQTVNNGDRRRFLAALPDMNEDLVRCIVRQHKHAKATATVVSLRSKLTDWAEAETSLHRQYFFYTVAQLRSRLKQLDGDAKLNGSKNEVLRKVVDEEKRSQQRAEAVAAGNATFQTSNDADPLLQQGLKSWFMKPLQGEKKSFCRKGHENETIFLEQLYRHSLDGNTGGYKIRSIFDSPLVCSTDNSLVGMLDSADGEIVVEHDDGTTEIMPVEIKSRLSHTTFHDESNRIDAVLGADAYEHGEFRFIELDAESPALDQWIPKASESFQLLHHVAIRNLRKGLIIVGNRTKLMFGVVVRYSDDTVAAYHDVLGDLYNRVLAPFYGPSDQLDTKKVDAALKSDLVKNLGVSIHSFMLHYSTWRKLRVEEAVALPIPPCTRILLYIHSLWNNLKTVSDTSTKLFWNCQVKMPGARAQSVACGRILQLFSVSLHRFNHVANADPDLDRYASLFHYRNAKNQQWPYHKTLDNLATILLKKSKEHDSINNNNRLETTFGAHNFPLSPAPPIRTSNRRPFQEHRVHATHTGATPARGRPKKPKTLTAAHIADQERLRTCRGVIHKTTSKEKRGCCYLCGDKTFFFCAGCNRWYCMSNKDKKMKKLYDNNDDRVAWWPSQPASSIEIKAVGTDGNVVGSYSIPPMENSCFHIQHQHGINQTVSENIGSFCNA